MYKILKNERRFGNKTFTTYNEARSYVATKVGTTAHKLRLKEHGFSIQKV